MPTGLLGYASEMPSGKFQFCWEDESVQIIHCDVEDLAPATEKMKAFEVVWIFSVDDDQYGEVNARVVGANAEQAKATAKAATETFKYDDERIKDRRSELSIATRGEFLEYDDCYQPPAKTAPPA